MPLGGKARGRPRGPAIRLPLPPRRFLPWSCHPRGGGAAGREGPHHLSGCLSTVYWLAGARVCFTVCSGLFLLPFLLLRNLRPPARMAPKAE